MNVAFETIVVPAAYALEMFRRGQRLFDQVWPSLQAEEQRRLEEWEEKRRASRDRKKKKLEEASARSDAYRQAMDDWRRKPKWLRGPEPDFPDLAWPYFDMSEYWMPPGGYASELRHEIDQAVKAAEAGFEIHMTQAQYERMHAWADGEVFATPNPRARTRVLEPRP